MNSAVTFFPLEPRVHRKKTSRPKEYFSSEPVKSLINKIDKKSIRWLKFIPAVALIGVGAAFLPYFALGCAIATGVFAIKIVMIAVFDTFVTSEMKKNIDGCLKINN